MDVPEISVIVPVYNVEKYLDRCVSSILNQTFKDFECILVDDGSPDNCPDMCDKYAAEEKCIRVIHKANGGLSDARNAGLDVCRGRYILFVDSDDWIHPQTLEILHAIAVKTDAGITVCRELKVSEQCKEYQTVNIDDILNKAETYNSDEVFNDFTYKYFWKIGPYSCFKLYKNEIFNNLRFDTSMKLYEDEYIYVDTIDKAKIVAWTDVKLYYYFQNTNSLMLNKLTDRFFLTFKSLQHISDFMRERGIYREVNLFERRWMMGYMDLYYRIKTEAPELMTDFRKYKPAFRKKYMDLFKNPELTRAYKVLLALFILNPMLAKGLYIKLTS